jgi:hypothetical protein
MRGNTRDFVSLAAVGLCLAIFTSITQGSIKTWSGVSNTDLANSGNWLIGVPGATDDAEFSSNAAPNPTAGTLSPLGIRFTNTAKPYNIGGGAISITGNGYIDTFTSAQPQTFSNSLLSADLSGTSPGIVASSDVAGAGGKLIIASTVFNFKATSGIGIVANRGDVDITGGTFTATGGGQITTALVSRKVTITPPINVGNGQNAAATDSDFNRRCGIHLCQWWICRHGKP